MLAKILFLLGASLIVGGCAQKELPFEVDGRVVKTGGYSTAEVESLRASIAKLTFPVPEHTIAKMLPRPVEGVPIHFLDWAEDLEKKGRVGGNVVEYWLNREFVLKVATAYYSEGDTHPSREEWAVVLARGEREHFSRPIYPNGLTGRIAK